MAIDTRKARRNYVALTLTITSGSPQNLLSIINAALASANAECPGAAREVNIQNASGNTASIFVGDANVNAATNCGYELAAGSSGAVGASRTYRGPVSCVPVGEFYIFASVAAQKINVEVTVL